MIQKLWKASLKCDDMCNWSNKWITKLGCLCIFISWFPFPNWFRIVQLWSNSNEKQPYLNITEVMQSKWWSTNGLYTYPTWLSSKSGEPNRADFGLRVFPEEFVFSQLSFWSLRRQTCWKWSQDNKQKCLLVEQWVFGVTSMTPSDLWEERSKVKSWKSLFLEPNRRLSFRGKGKRWEIHQIVSNL